MTGKQLKKTLVNNNETKTLSVSVTDLPKGMYLLTVKDSNVQQNNIIVVK